VEGYSKQVEIINIAFCCLQVCSGLSTAVQWRCLGEAGLNELQGKAWGWRGTLVSHIHAEETNCAPE